MPGSYLLDARHCRFYLFGSEYSYLWASLVAQTVKNLPAVRETWVQSLGGERSLGEVNGNPLQYSCLKDSMGRGAWQATVHGLQRVRPD